MAVERKDNIVCCLCLRLKFPREKKSAAAPIARSNDSPCTRADFPTKKSSHFEDEKLHVIATLFINYFHQLEFIYFLKRSDHDYFDETELYKLL